MAAHLGHNRLVGGAWTLPSGAGLLCALVLAGGCAARAPAATAATRPASASSAASARSSPSATALPPDPPWIVDLKAELTALRGLPFKRPVAFGTQTQAEFRAQVRSELSHDLPATKSANVSRSYTALGLASSGFDLSKAMEEALATQVAAYYDPKLRAFKVIGTDIAIDDPKRAPVVSHELVHALQDQYFDLERFSGDGDDAGLDEDERQARRFLIEGEATFLMMAHGLGSGPPSERRLGSWSVAGLRMEIRMLAALDMVQLAASLRQGNAAESLDAESRAELTALANLPPVVTVSFFEPYYKGAEMVSEVWAAGGWPAVDALFRDPPTSTEQALHPADKLLGHRDPPVHLRLDPKAPPPVAGARSLASEVVGELGWRIYFRTWNRPDAEAAASGWGGDRYWTWAVGDRTLTLVATTWDSVADAKRFAAAYEATLADRFPRRTIAAMGESGLRLDGTDGLVVALVRRDRDVDLVSGAKPEELGAAETILQSVTRTR